MEKKKILFLIPTLGGGGAERVLVNLVNGMDLTMYDVTVQSIYRAGVHSSSLAEGIRFIQGRVKQFSGCVMLLKLFSPSFLYKRIVKEDYDVVISYLEGQSARIASGCTNPKTKKLQWIHCTFTSLKEISYSFRSEKETIDCYTSFNGIAYVSKNVKDAFVRYIPGLRNNHVIYNTNDDKRIQSMAVEDVDDIEFSNSVNVISTGRLIPVKGFERLVDAHVRLINDCMKHHVYIVGCGALEEKLKSMIDEKGVKDTFHLLGFKTNPYKYIAKADLFACTSLSEGFSTVVTESLILGKPVLSTDVSGAKEQLGENNEYGLVVENSAEGVYKGLKKLLSDKELFERYTKAAQKRGKYFSMERSVKSVEDLIESL